MKPFSFISIVDAGIRPADSYGIGTFGASRDGGTRSHLGLDFGPIEANKQVIAPCDCEYSRRGYSYRSGIGGAGSDEPYELIELETSFFRIKILYVKPYGFVKGEKIRCGQAIGVTQDLSRRYPKDKAHPLGINNHVHFELIPVGLFVLPHEGHIDRDNLRINPELFFWSRD